MRAADEYLLDLSERGERVWLPARLGLVPARVSGAAAR